MQTTFSIEYKAHSSNLAARTTIAVKIAWKVFQLNMHYDKERTQKNIIVRFDFMNCELNQSFLNGSFCVFVSGGWSGKQKSFNPFFVIQRFFLFVRSTDATNIS